MELSLFFFFLNRIKINKIGTKINKTDDRKTTRKAHNQ
jgi:hypothetical protein